MSTALFPLGSALAWSVHLAPSFDTRIASHVSGREKRAAMRTWPLWDITLNWDALHSNDGSAQDLQAILGFFVARKGSWDDFLLDLGAATHVTTDSYATNQWIGTGDGNTTVFPLLRPVTLDPVGYVSSADLSAVKVGGAPASYSFASPNTITLASPAPTGAAITATYRHYMLCRFSADSADFEAFSAGLWQLHELKLRSVIP